MERSSSFGAAAEEYERFRMTYPDDVVDEVLAYAGHPVRDAIELGAGTGKATRVFAQRGIRVIASDPDGSMLAELQRRVPTVTAVVRAPLESLPALEPVDLVFAAASLHWTEPTGRWRRIARLLRPGGVFASMAIEMEIGDADLRSAVEAAWDRVGVAPHVPPPDEPDRATALQWPATELLSEPLFDDVRERRIRRETVLSVDDYVGLQSTLSSYLTLPRREQLDLLAGLRRALPPSVEMTADAVLHLARRAT